MLRLFWQWSVTFSVIDESSTLQIDAFAAKTFPSLMLAGLDQLAEARAGLTEAFQCLSQTTLGILGARIDCSARMGFVPKGRLSSHQCLLRAPYN